MKSVNEILNSLFAPAAAPPAGGAAVGSKGASGQGSFEDFMSRLASPQSDSTQSGASNASSGQTSTPNSGTAPAGGSGSQGSFESVLSVSEVDVRVTETASLGAAALKDIPKLEQAVTALAVGLSQLVNLASTVQGMDPQKAQSLLVSAGGGLISPGDAQKLVQLIQSMSQGMDQSQNPLLMSSGDQKNLLAQMLQQMIQSGQLGLAQSNNAANSLTVSNAGIAGGGAGSAGLLPSVQLLFSEGQTSQAQSGAGQQSSLSMDIQTFQVKLSSAPDLGTLSDQGLQKAVQEIGLQIQSALPPSQALSQDSTNLSQNFKNLVQALSQSGAGQVILNSFVSPQKNASLLDSRGALLQPPSLEDVVKSLTSGSEVPAVSAADSAALGGENPLGNQEGSSVVAPQVVAVPALSELSGPKITFMNQLVDQLNLFAGQGQPAAPLTPGSQPAHFLGAQSNATPPNPSVTVDSLLGHLAAANKTATITLATPSALPAVNSQTPVLNPLNQKTSLVADDFLPAETAERTILPVAASDDSGNLGALSGEPSEVQPVVSPQVSLVPGLISTPDATPDQAGPAVPNSSALAPSIVSEVAHAAFVVESFRLSQQAQTALPAPTPQPVAAGQNLSTSLMAGVAAQGSLGAASSHDAGLSVQNFPSGMPSGSDIKTLAPQAVTPVLSASESGLASNDFQGRFEAKAGDSGVQLEGLLGSAASNLGLDNKAGFGNLLDDASSKSSKTDSAQIFNQVADQIGSNVSGGKMISQLSFQLVPENLGRVTVQIGLVDQSVSARIMVSNQGVKDALQHHMVELKATLNNFGLQIDQMEVNVQGGGSSLWGQYYQYQQEGFGNHLPGFLSEEGLEDSKTLDNTGVLGASSVRRSLVNVLA